MTGATQLIPISWLAFLAHEDLASLKTRDVVSIDRVRAIKNYDDNKSFFAMLIGDQLAFHLSERLAKPVRASAANRFVIDIGDLLPPRNEICVLEEVFTAIREKDCVRQFSLRRRKSEVTGTMRPPIHFPNTLEMLNFVCWITPRMLQIATRKERETMVVGELGK